MSSSSSNTGSNDRLDATKSNASNESNSSNDPLTLKVMQSLTRKRKQGNNDSGSSNGGNNSDNSALISLGNTSFGFNFDSSEEQMSNANSEKNETSSEDGENNNKPKGKKNTDRQHQQQQHHYDGNRGSAAVTSSNDTNSSGSDGNNSSGQQQNQSQGGMKKQHTSTTSSSDAHSNYKSSISSLTNTSNSNSNDDSNASRNKKEEESFDPHHHAMSADRAVKGLQSLAYYGNCNIKGDNENTSGFQMPTPGGGVPSTSDFSSKNYKNGGPKSDVDSGGYNTDNESQTNDNDQESSSRYNNSSAINYTHSTTSAQSRDDSSIGESYASSSMAGGRKKRRKVDNKKREERNAREKERSFRISAQINDLRSLLSSGGVVVPKGTKSSVLTEAASYIRLLQQHQYRSEIDRHQLIQQMQTIGNGAHGPQAASAIKHFAAQNGVWSLGNFGGMPPNSANVIYPSSSSSGQNSSGTSTVDQSSTDSKSRDPLKQMSLDTSDYRLVFNTCGVGMALASMGGAFTDCNNLFCQLSGYSKQELSGLTIFNLTARQDLQNAFDLISQMISPSLDTKFEERMKSTIMLRGAMKTQNDFGLSVSLIRGEDSIVKCFCVTLVKNPELSYNASSSSVAVSYDAVPAAQTNSIASKDNSDVSLTPTFTSG